MSKTRTSVLNALKTLLVCVIAALASSAIADPSSRVGRISLVQGQVDFRANYDERAVDAMVNWPITSQNVIATARGGRVEVRVGSTAVRLDGDSELEIMQLDDQNFKISLRYGSASVRIRNGDMAQDFELRTPQGKVLMLEPSTLRVDTERIADVTGLGVFSGMARFEGSGSSLVVRAGKHLDIGDGNLRTNAIFGDPFDDWTLARDRADEQSMSAQYVSPETTGYEDLDRSGTWQVTAEYGAIWYPYVVPAGWAPYRHGRWVWVAPWGYTWIDNAPWGYAPSHYGRWTWFNQRWCWAPGRLASHPVWAPAVVGWIGDGNWNVRFSTGNAPGIGWFPLAPHERYVPGYHVSSAYMDRVNQAAFSVNNGINQVRNNHYRNRDEHNGVTVVPHQQFVSSSMMVVDTAPKVMVPPPRFPTTAGPTSQPIPNPGVVRNDPAPRRVVSDLPPRPPAVAAAVAERLAERRPERWDPRPVDAMPVSHQTPEARPPQTATAGYHGGAVAQPTPRDNPHRQDNKIESAATMAVALPTRSPQRQAEPAHVIPPRAEQHHPQGAAAEAMQAAQVVVRNAPEAGRQEKPAQASPPPQREEAGRPPRAIPEREHPSQAERAENHAQYERERRPR